MTVSLVGIDVGGSKTAIRVADASGRTTADLAVPTGKWRGEYWAGKAAALTAAVDEAIGATPAALAVGAHGCDTDEQCAALEAELRALLGIPVRVVNDARLLAFAAGKPNAVGLIAGTGAIAVGRTAQGRTVHAGGWGWLVGDDGGATGIVRETVRAALIARDAGTPDDVLERVFVEVTGLSSIGEVSYRMMLEPPERWARLALAVFEAADAESPVARTALGLAVASLGTLVTAVGRLGASLDDVVVGGGVVRAQDDYAEAIARHIGALHPRARVTILADDPVAGAVAIARSLIPLVPTHPNTEGRL